MPLIIGGCSIGSFTNDSQLAKYLHGLLQKKGCDCPMITGHWNKLSVIAIRKGNSVDVKINGNTIFVR